MSHADCSEHHPGELHPESPDRLDAIRDHLISMRVIDMLVERDAPEVTREQLERVHDGQYLDELETLQPSEGLKSIDPDTWLSPATLAAARRAAGAAVEGVDLVMSGETDRVFCGVRPPGHHAESNRAMGFCFYNNIAVAAAHAIKVYKVKRVAIVDFDAHWGNGTDQIFAKQKKVGIFASFEDHLFPDGDVPSVPGRIHNVALPPGASSQEMRHAWHDELWPALDAFKPQLILVSAGFDGHREDDISHLRFSDEDYTWLTDHIVDIAEKHAKGRIVSLLEGGYALPALGRSVALHLKALLGE
ncbi:MAG: histone deacetylase family protein [Gammaproteobacteria bacterium]|nr:histone deacetylase family protein [Gammaproteobacteria bacterium]